MEDGARSTIFYLQSSIYHRQRPWPQMGSSEVLHRDDNQIEWNRHPGNIHEICRSSIEQSEADVSILPRKTMLSQR